MKSTKTKAYILKKANIGEADRLITAFSQDYGKMVFKASGIRKISSRRAAHMELLNLVEVVLYNKGHYKTLTSSHLLCDFSVTKNSLNNVGYLFYLSEVIDKILPEYQPNEQVFALLTDCLDVLNKKEGLDVETQVKDLLVRILWELGYLPRKHYPVQGLTSFVEEIAERKIRSKKFVDELKDA